MDYDGFGDRSNNDDSENDNETDNNIRDREGYIDNEKIAVSTDASTKSKKTPRTSRYEKHISMAKTHEKYI